MQIKLKSKPYPISNTTFILNNQQYSGLRIPYQPILSSASSITLNSNNPKITNQLLSILSNKLSSVDITLFNLVIEQAKQRFDAELYVDYDDFAFMMIDEIRKQQRKITVQVLDSLSLGGITKVIDNARQYCTDDQTQDLLNILAQTYIKRSKRSEFEKNALSSRIFNTSHEPTSNNTQHKPIRNNNYSPIAPSSSNQSSSVQKYQKVQKYDKYDKKQKPYKQQRQQKLSIPKQNGSQQRNKKQEKIDSAYLFGKQHESEYKQKRSYQKNRSYDKGQQNKYSQKNSAKNNTRELISLGIYGNCNEEWRQRFRPQYYKSQEYYKQPITKILEPINSNISKTPSKVFDIPAQLQTKNKLYCYPHDEQTTFKFKAELIPFSIYLQPQNITIDFLNDHLDIKLEHGKSFRRQTKYAFVQNGILGEGVSILLNGLSVIEDGGDQLVQSENQNISLLNKWFFIQQAIISSIAAK